MSELDTFESPATEVADESQLETFDNFEVVEPEVKDEPPAEKDPTNLEDKQINAMENAKDEKEEEKEEEDGDGETKGEDDAGGSKDDKPSIEEDKSTAPKVKMLKGNVGDDKVEINPEAEIKVKIDGKRESVKVSDLINNYSGKTSWDKKYTELGEEKKAFQAENTQYKQELGWMQNNIKEVVNILDSEDRNPIDALMHLIDVTGRNPVQYQQKLFNTMQSEMENMMDMDEVEQELYWTKQNNAYLSRRQESLTTQANSEADLQQMKARIDSVRATHGVDENQFIEAHSELEDLGYENVTPEQAVNYAIIKPHLDAAEELVKDFEEEMTTDGADKLISDFATYLKNGEFTKEELKALLVEEYASSSEIDDLKDKVKDFPSRGTNNSSKVAAKEDGVESFDDFDEQFYGRNF